ncbi:unnamed protein product [Larinioides sclopetarius]|uniref:Cytochrome P450 n=1 Tax=Larinioides sclopetarius TaxID=280406 RepID=A0AAV2A0K9_9ARAC
MNYCHSFANWVPVKKCLWNIFTKSAMRNSSTVASEIDAHTEWMSAKPFSEIPSLPMLPFVGTAWHYMPIIGRYPLDRQHVGYSEKRKIFGDIHREKIGKLDIVITYNADDFRVIQRNEGKYPYRVEFDSVKAYRKSREHWFSTTGLMALQGEEWDSLRKKSQGHILKPGHVIRYIGLLREVVEEMVERMFEIRDGNNEIPDFKHELYKWTLESVCLVGLDTRLGCLERNLPEDSDGMKMINAVRNQFDCMIKLEAFSGRIQFWKVFPSPTWRKFVKYSDIYSEIAFKYINKAVSNLEFSEESSGRPLTLLQAMLKEKKLVVRDIMVVIADFLMAGIETTAHSAGFLLYHLARNPDKQELLYKEIMKLLPTKDHKITEKIYTELRYLNACFKEGLRLNPVVGGTARTLASDCVLSGYQVPAGTLATVPYQELFSHERYFEEPFKFIPERWLNKEKKTHPYAFMPFGFGVRSCIGRRLAEMEITLLVAEIIRKFKVEYHYEDIGVKTLLANAPDRPLRFTFIER